MKPSWCKERKEQHRSERKDDSLCAYLSKQAMAPLILQRCTFADRNSISVDTNPHPPRRPFTLSHTLDRSSVNHWWYTTSRRRDPCLSWQLLSSREAWLFFSAWIASTSCTRLLTAMRACSRALMPRVQRRPPEVATDTQTLTRFTHR